MRKKFNTIEERIANRKEWFVKNRERIRENLKIYNIKLRKKNRPKCRLCDKKLLWPCAGRKYCKNHKEERKDLLRNKIKLKRQEAQLQFDQYKIKLGCKNCGYNECAAALDFHHIDPIKKKCRIRAKGFHTKNNQDELKKCELICANCHRQEHYKRS